MATAGTLSVVGDVNDGDAHMLGNKKGVEPGDGSEGSLLPEGTSNTYTLEEAVQSIGFGRFQRRVGFVVGGAFVCDALEMMLLSFLGPMLRCEWKISSADESLLTTFVFIGMMAGLDNGTFSQRPPLFPSSHIFIYCTSCCVMSDE